MGTEVGLLFPAPTMSPESRLSQARGLALVVELQLCVLSWGFPPGLLSQGLDTLLISNTVCV